MRVGFTGTQSGMTVQQRLQVEMWLTLVQPIESVHHGMCIGADEQFHEIARSRELIIIGHPGVTESGLALKRSSVVCDSVGPEQFYLDRNRDIVNSVDFMIATPGQMVEQQRSGTWATIRYAQKKRRRLTIIYPDGTTNGPR